MKSCTINRRGLRGLLALSFFTLFSLHNIFGKKYAWKQTFGLVDINERRKLIEKRNSKRDNILVNVDSLTSQPVLKRGFTPKSGPTKLHYWTAGNRTERHAAFESWVKITGPSFHVKQNASQLNEVLLPKLPPMYPNCQILVNHRYKFIYIRHPKSASSSVMMYFTTCPSATPAPPGASGGSSQGRSMLLEESDLEAFTGAQGDGNTDSRMAVGPNPPQAPRDRPEDGTHASSWQAASERAGGGEGLQNSGGRVDVKSGSTAGHPAALRLGAACLEPLVVSELSAEEVARMWQEYFVFSVVRNPYQRMLSSYKYLLRKTRANATCKVVRWDDFCADPLSLGRMCEKQSWCCPLPAGFYWHHVIDQARCLETEDGGWATDYVAAVEHFQEHMQEIVAEIDRRRSPELPPLRQVTASLTHQNEARGTGAAAAACTEGADLSGLEPEKTKVLSPVRGWVSYKAPVLQDRHCNTADYFRGEHWRCLLQAQHFYASDLRRLYSDPAANLTLSEGLQQGENDQPPAIQ